MKRLLVSIVIMTEKGSQVTFVMYLWVVLMHYPKMFATMFKAWKIQNFSQGKGLFHLFAFRYNFQERTELYSVFLPVLLTGYGSIRFADEEICG